MSEGLRVEELVTPEVSQERVVTPGEVLRDVAQDIYESADAQDPVSDERARTGIYNASEYALLLTQVRVAQARLHLVEHRNTYAHGY